MAKRSDVLEFAVLGLLHEAPMHGYELRKRLNATLGAFRADVSGAGPVVYGLFHHREQAEEAKRSLSARGRVWLTVPAWYG